MLKILEALLQQAAGVSTAWSLAAYAIAALTALLLLGGGQRRAAARAEPGSEAEEGDTQGPAGPSERTDARLTLAGVGAIVLLGSLPILVRACQEQPVYRVRATLLGPAAMPLDNAKVWSSVGGEPKAVSGGWEFTIPASTRPADGKMTVYAAVPSAFLRGETSLVLNTDFNPVVVVRLANDQSAQVRGSVMDLDGRSVRGAKVSLVGYGAEAATTDAEGSFALPSHAAEGQQVEVHVVAADGRSVNQWLPAGSASTVLVPTPAASPKPSARRRK